MILSELNKDPRAEATALLNECRVLVTTLNEYISLSTRSSESPDIQQSSPPKTLNQHTDRVMYPGKTSVVQKALVDLRKASETLDNLKSDKVKSGQFEPAIYKRVVNILREIRDKLRSYEELKSKVS